MAALKKHQSHHPDKHHPAEASLQGHHERFHIRHRATDPPRRPTLRGRLKSYKAAVSRAAHGALGLLECVRQQQVESAPAERCFIFNLRFLQLVMGTQTSPRCGLHLGPLNGWRGHIKDPVNLVFYTDTLTRDLNIRNTQFQKDEDRVYRATNSRAIHQNIRSLETAIEKQF